MEKVRYRDFVVQLSLEGRDLLRARVLASPAGEGECTQPLPDWLAFPVAGPPGEEVPGRSSRDVKRRRPEESPTKVRAEYGAQLHELLFAGQVGRLWDQSLGAVRGDPGAGLRLRLQIDLASAGLLAELPWELLFRRDTATYLSLDRQTPVLRHLEVPQPVAPPLPGGLRILVAAAAPRELVSLDLESEQRQLRRERRKARAFQVHFLERPTVAELRRALVERRAHVLHFMGHGGFDPELGEGVVFFENAAGGTEPWTGEGLAEKLADLAFLRLVVLNACQTAISGGSGADPYGGVAAALVRGGLPAVVAMQRPISDVAAIAFSGAFYRELAAGAGIEAALTEGRQAIHTLDPSEGEWAIPVLFGRASALGIGELDDQGLPVAWHWLFGLVLAGLLGLTLAPPPARAGLGLSLKTSWLGFRLPAGEQQVFESVRVNELGATDLGRVDLGTSRPAPAAARYDLLITGRTPEASITLQRDRLPGGSWVRLERQQDGRYRLEVNAPNEIGSSFEAVASGPSRVLLRPLGSAPVRFEVAGEPAEVLRFASRGRRLRWDLAPVAGGLQLHPAIPVEGLELFAAREEEGRIEGRKATRLAARFDLAGELTVAGAGPIRLVPGTPLRLDEPRGVLQKVLAGPDGIEMVFSGSVAGLRRGGPGVGESLMPPRTTLLETLRRLMLALALLLAAAEMAYLARPLWRSVGRLLPGRRKGVAIGSKSFS